MRMLPQSSLIFSNRSTLKVTFELSRFELYPYLQNSLFELSNVRLWQSLLFELPLLPAHGALVLGLLGPQPLHDAVDVEAVAALTPHLRKCALVTKNLAPFQNKPEGNHLLQIYSQDSIHQRQPCKCVNVVKDRLYIIHRHRYCSKDS